jgi:hypothetical protein
LLSQIQLVYRYVSAFKAANPAACLADFVRWHSPRDWIAPEEGSGGAGASNAGGGSSLAPKVGH